ncbi:hypothetical protein D9M73_128670 [compost metagenome]
MPYVQRSVAKVIGLYANPQPGYAEEFLPPEDAEVLEFLNPQPTFAAEKDRLLTMIRGWRKDAYNALIGIGFAAKEEGDEDTVTACLTARQQLKDITDWPAVTEAATTAALQAALVTRWNQIAAACPPNVQTAFSEYRK